MNTLTYTKIAEDFIFVVGTIFDNDENTNKFKEQNEELSTLVQQLLVILAVMIDQENNKMLAKAKEEEEEEEEDKELELYRLRNHLEQLRYKIDELEEDFEHVENMIEKKEQAMKEEKEEEEKKEEITKLCHMIKTQVLHTYITNGWDLEEFTTTMIDDVKSEEVKYNMNNEVIECNFENIENIETKED